MITIFAAVEQALIDNAIEKTLRIEFYTTREGAGGAIANWAQKETLRGFTWNWNTEMGRWERWIGDALHVMRIEEHVVRDERPKDPFELYDQFRIINEQPAYMPYSDCMHDNCPSCKGSGYDAYGKSCVHGIACPCSKCRITC